MRLKSLIKKQLQLIRYRGHTLECPICQYRARAFLPAGLYQKRPNSKCPKCGSLERHRIMMLLFKEQFKSQKQLDLLHFAPEKCFKSLFDTLLGGSYQTSEYSQDSQATHHFDIQNIDAPDHSYDIIICSHVLEHVPDDRKALKEILRVLRPSGKAYIQVPMWPSENHPTYENPSIDDPRDRIIHFGQWDHLRIYGHDFLQTIQNVGFSKIDIVNPLQYFDQSTIGRYQLKNFGGVVDYTFIAHA